MALIYTLPEFLDGLKSRMLKNCDIENDPIIKDQMTNLSCLFVCTFGDYLAPVLIAAQAANNLDLGYEPEEEDYEGEGP